MSLDIGEDTNFPAQYKNSRQVVPASFQEWRAEWEKQASIGKRHGGRHIGPLARAYRYAPHISDEKVHKTYGDSLEASLQDTFKTGFAGKTTRGSRATSCPRTASVQAVEEEAPDEVLLELLSRRVRKLSSRKGRLEKPDRENLVRWWSGQLANAADPIPQGSQTFGGRQATIATGGRDLDVVLGYMREQLGSVATTTDEARASLNATRGLRRSTRRGPPRSQSAPTGLTGGLDDERGLGEEVGKQMRRSMRRIDEQLVRVSLCNLRNNVDLSQHMPGLRTIKNYRTASGGFR